MSVTGINHNMNVPQAFKTSNNAKLPASSETRASPQVDDAALQELIDYFFESPAQRIVDNWLRAHNITKEQFNAMPPEQQESIRRQIADEIKKRTEDRAKARSGI